MGKIGMSIEKKILGKEKKQSKYGLNGSMVGKIKVQLVLKPKRAITSKINNACGMIVSDADSTL